MLILVFLSMNTFNFTLWLRVKPLQIHKLKFEDVQKLYLGQKMSQ